MTRIGILGGTFDPVHNGHLAVAEAAWRALALERVLFVPAFLPPHKPDSALAPFAERAAMLDLALRDREGFAVSAIEAERGGPSYSIDTLRALRERHEPEAEFFFLIGADAFADIHFWKQYRRIPDYAHLAVLGRPDICRTSCGEMVARDFPDFFFDQAQGCWLRPDCANAIYPVAMPPVPISSTAVRQAIRQGSPVSGLVPGPVAEYLRSHSLYRSKGS